MARAPHSLANDSRPTLLSDLVHDRLLASIIGGEFAPGDRLQLDELAEQYGVSRTPVREAVMRLARNNLVLVARNSRSVVAPWSVSDMRERLTAIAAMAEAGVSYLTSAALEALRDVFAEITQPEERIVVDLIDAVLEAAYPLLGEQLRDDLIAPLRLFYVRGQNPADTDREVLAAWVPVAAALRIQDRNRFAVSLSDAFEALIATLRTSAELADA